MTHPSNSTSADPFADYRVLAELATDCLLAARYCPSEAEVAEEYCALADAELNRVLAEHSPPPQAGIASPLPPTGGTIVPPPETSTIVKVSPPVASDSDNCPNQIARPHRQRQPVPGGLRTAAQAAAKLNMSVKTLTGHVASGALGYVIIGHGKKRPRKRFTDSDLDAFIANQTRKDSPSCLSTKSRARHTGTSTSSGTVIDFTGPRKPPTDAKRKK
jgi:hypothetical protein